MIIGAVPGVRGIDDGRTGAWYAELRRRYYHTILGREQLEPGNSRRAALPRNIIGMQHFGGNGGRNNGQRRGREVHLNPDSFANDGRY
jgi:hypothetical protein